MLIMAAILTLVAIDFGIMFLAGTLLMSIFIFVVVESKNYHKKDSLAIPIILAFITIFVFMILLGSFLFTAEGMTMLMGLSFGSLFPLAVIKGFYSNPKTQECSTFSFPQTEKNEQPGKGYIIQGSNVIITDPQVRDYFEIFDRYVGSYYATHTPDQVRLKSNIDILYPVENGENP